MHYQHHKPNGIIALKNSQVVVRKTFHSIFATPVFNTSLLDVIYSAIWNYFNVQLDEICALNANNVGRLIRNISDVRKKIFPFILSRIFFEFQREQFDKVDIFLRNDSDRMEYVDQQMYMKDTYKNMTISVVYTEPKRCIIPISCFFPQNPHTVMYMLNTCCVLRFTNSKKTIVAVCGMKNSEMKRFIGHKTSTLGDNTSFETEFKFYTGKNIRHWATVDLSRYHSVLIDGLAGYRMPKLDTLLERQIDMSLSKKPTFPKNQVVGLLDRIDIRRKKIGFSLPCIHWHRMHIESEDAIANLELHNIMTKCTLMDKNALSTQFTVNNSSQHIHELAGVINDFFKIKEIGALDPIDRMIPECTILI